MTISQEVERVALLALLTRSEKMHWAEYRDELVTGRLPSELVEEFELERGEHVLATWRSAAPGASFYTYLDTGYPHQLRDVWDFPPFVFVQGDEAPMHKDAGDIGVAIVGSRQASQAAVRDVESLVRFLADEDVSIVSGLAGGVDQAAHRAAFKFGARTVGIIGTGIDRYYPHSSQDIQRRLEGGEGMVLSQFKPGSSPSRSSFPMRNAVMSAYARATIIVEASEASGTRHQAKSAIKHGRPLILSESVVRQTTWGQQLSHDRSLDLTVAESPAKAAELAKRILSRSVSSVKRESIDF